jgi:hypothetical protein
VPASVTIHTVLAALTILAVPAPMPPPRPPRSIAVEVISRAEFAAMTRPVPAPLSPATTAPAPTAPSGAASPASRLPEEPAPAPRAEAGDETIRATELYAGALLAEPASANLRRAMRTLEVNERLVQLCDIEAMAQVRAARPEFDPDMVVAYAMTPTGMRDGALVADGAAFRSRREWYALNFTCEGLPDLSGVTAFSFSVGELIPHELWDGYYLTAEESDEGE